MTRDTGYQRLWLWFGLSRASWLTLPRVLMHEMPDDWQERMAVLLEEWDDEHSRLVDTPDTFVSAKRGRRFCKFPSWLLNYRHPDVAIIAARKEGKA